MTELEPPLFLWVMLGAMGAGLSWAMPHNCLPRAACEGG